MKPATGTKNFAQTTPCENRPDYERKIAQPNSRSASKLEIASVGSADITAKHEVDEERIRQRAYQLYAEGGFQDGNAESDWLAAEQELADKEGEA
jgi:hypothetical protein